MENKLRIVSEKHCDKKTEERMKRITKLKGVEKAVALPDVSMCSHETPMSTAIKTKGVIYPEFLPMVNNCGVGILKTDLTPEDLTKEKIEKFGRKIKSRHSNSRFKIDREKARGLMEKGAELPAEEGGFIDLENVENKGNMFRNNPRYFNDFNKVIPNIFLRRFINKRPYMGIRGNHFIEFHTVDEIIDEKIVSEWGLEREEVLLILHGDPRLSVIFNHLYGCRKHLKETGSFQGKIKVSGAKIWFLLNSSSSIKEIKNRAGKSFSKDLFTPHYTDTKEGKRMIDMLNYVMNYGYGLRTIFYLYIFETINELFGSSNIELLRDYSHDSIQKENNSWVSRRGSCRLSDNKPSLVIGSYDFNSCLGVGGDNREKYLNSHDHGCSNFIKKDNEIKKDKKILRFNLRDSKLTKVRIKESDPIKNLMDLLNKREILNPVVWTRPLAGFKDLSF